MALKLISMLSVLILASFAYKVWDKTKVPDDIPPEDIWKVKTIEFVCRIVRKLMDLMVYLNLDVYTVGRVLQSYSFNTMHYGIWPFNALSQSTNDSLVRTYRREMAGVPVILYQHSNRSINSSDHLPGAVLIYFHGGGWVWLDAEYPSPTLRLISRELGIDTISVEYRLAPEHPYPAGLDDCLAVTEYVIKQHKELGLDPSKIIIAGDSAGGNLAAAVALRLKKKVRLQVLIYPVLQALDFQTPSHRENSAKLKYILSLGHVVGSVVRYGALPHQSSIPSMLDNRHISQATRLSKYSNYLQSSLMTRTKGVTKLSTLHYNTLVPTLDKHSIEEIERRVLDENFMPLMAESLDDVADAYVVTAQHDILRDDGLYYGDRLSKSNNVKVTIRNYEQGFHTFFHFSQGPLKVGVAERAVKDLIDFIDSNVIKERK